MDVSFQTDQTNLKKAPCSDSPGNFTRNGTRHGYSRGTDENRGFGRILLSSRHPAGSEDKIPEAGTGREGTGVLGCGWGSGGEGKAPRTGREHHSIQHVCAPHSMAAVTQILYPTRCPFPSGPVSHPFPMAPFPTWGPDAASPPRLSVTLKAPSPQLSPTDGISYGSAGHAAVPRFGCKCVCTHRPIFGPYPGSSVVKHAA